MKITIIGLGAIGGSIALDLKARGFVSYIIGIDNNPDHCRQALDKGLVNEVKSLADDSTALHSDLIILSTPVTQIAKLLPGILDNLGEHSVVMDVGSTKGLICKAVKNHRNRKQFVGTHPVVISEGSGPMSAVNNLFDNKICILCVDDSALWVVERVSELYEALNMKPLFMNAEDHDLHAAHVSHLTYISSFALTSTVLEMEKNPSGIIDFAGAGFTSAARLAKSPAVTWAPVFEQNSKYISKALGSYIKHLTKFKKDIDKKNIKGIHQAIAKANAIGKII